MRAVTKNAAIALSALVLASAIPWVVAQTAQAPLAVMTDTPEYCGTLRERLDQMPAEDASQVVLSEVRLLESEGLRLCYSGEPRGGIIRLRRAIMMMMNASHEPDEDR